MNIDVDTLNLFCQRRKSWPVDQVISTLTYGEVVTHTFEKADYKPYQPSEEDIQADDWEYLHYRGWPDNISLVYTEETPSLNNPPQITNMILPGDELCMKPKKQKLLNY